MLMERRFRVMGIIQNNWLTREIAKGLGKQLGALLSSLRRAKIDLTIQLKELKKEELTAQNQ